MGVFTLSCLLTAKVISLGPSADYVSGIGNEAQVYEKLKSQYPQYIEAINDSLALDDFARYKLEKSYSEQELPVLQKKFSSGQERIRKGAYGVLIWRLDDLGEMKG